MKIEEEVLTLPEHNRYTGFISATAQLVSYIYLLILIRGRGSDSSVAAINNPGGSPGRPQWI